MSFTSATLTIKKILDEMKISNDFTKRQFTAEGITKTDEKEFTNLYCFELFNDKTSLIDKFKEGDSVTVSFNIKCNESEKDGKISYFTALNAWRIEEAKN